MKKLTPQYLTKGAMLAVILAAAPLAFAQDSMQTTTTRTTSVGTVSALSPDAITVTTHSSTTPVRFAYSKTTTYVDENGNPVSIETVRSGAPVTVFYSQDGDRFIATKVVVAKPMDADASPIARPEAQATDEPNAGTTTTTTSSDGTVATFSSGAMTIESQNSPAPVNYTFSKTTTYVDENGNPVSVETVKSGVPVTVFYDRNGDQNVATRVVVHNAPTTVKKTTTTTTTNGSMDQ